MAVTLAQAAVLSSNDLQRGVLETFVQTSPVLDRLPLITINGNAYAYNQEATLPGVAFRSVNEAYTESTGTFNQLTESLVILGGDADVDRFIVQTRGNLADQRAVQTALKVKAASYKFQDAFFNGDTAVDAKSFDGLKKRLTGAQVISAATNGAGVNADAATRSAFFDRLDDLLAAVPGINPANGAIYANAAILSKFRSALRNSNQSTRRSPTPSGSASSRGTGSRSSTRSQRGRHRGAPSDGDAGLLERRVVGLRGEVRAGRDRPWRVRPHERWGAGRRPRLPAVAARLPHPARVLLRSRGLRREGRSPPHRRPELLSARSTTDH
jgi:hypothetical protein